MVNYLFFDVDFHQLKIFSRVSTLFKASDEVSDNALVSIYPFNDEYFALTDTPVIHKIDPEALDTLERINLQDKLGIINHTSHPHVMTDGSVYNLGLSIYKTGPAYNIIHFPSGENIFKNARIVAEIPSRWKLHPSYMHTFGITENYFIIVEQPFTLSVPKIFKTQFTKKPMLSCLKWFPESFSNFYLIDRKSGQLKYKFHAEAFFYFHIINQYEKEDHVVIDISCYRDPEILMSCFSVESMRDMQNNPDYAKMFRSRPFRFVLPLRASTKLNLWRRFKASMFKKVSLEESTLENLVKIDNSDAKAFSMSNGSIFCKPEILCNFGCELPQINRVKYLSKEYQYFYAISTDVDAEHPGAIRKVDVVNKTSLTWSEINCYLSEPIFVPSHDQQSEDDGVVLASMIWGRHETNRVGLIVLDAKTMKELGRCEFNDLPGPVPKCLHGWFADANGK